MSQIIENYSAFNTSFAGHRYQIEKVIKGQAGVLNPQYIQGAQHTFNTTSLSAFNGGCLTANGVCVFAPWHAPYAGVYDYVSNTFNETGGHGMTATSFCGAAMVDDRYVAFIPYAAAYVCFLNIATGVIERGPAHLKSTLSAFSGGAVTEDSEGRSILVMAPTGSNKLGIVYLDSREYADGPTLTGCRGAQLLPNGHVAMFSVGITLTIYDPVKNVTYTPYDQSSGSVGGVVLPDGRLTMDSSNKSAFSTITPTAGLTGWPYVNSAAFSPNSSNKYNGIKLLPNGDLAAIPGEKSTITLYTPPSPKNYKGVITDGPTLPATPGPDKFSGGLMAPNGDIIMIPDRSQYVGIYRHMDNAKGFPIEVCASRYYGSAF